MTQLARNNMHMGFRVAGRTFNAKCGHRIQKGDTYLVIDDYSAGHKYHDSKCKRCANNGEEKEASS